MCHFRSLLHFLPFFCASIKSLPLLLMVVRYSNAEGTVCFPTSKSLASWGHLPEEPKELHGAGYLGRKNKMVWFFRMLRHVRQFWERENFFLSVFTPLFLFSLYHLQRGLIYMSSGFNYLDCLVSAASMLPNCDGSIWKLRKLTLWGKW